MNVRPFVIAGLLLLVGFVGMVTLTTPAKAIFAPSLVGSASGHSASNNVTIPAVAPSGDTLFVFVYASNPAGAMSVSDTNSDTFTQIVNQSSIRVFKASIGSAITSFSITATGSTWILANGAWYSNFDYVSHVTDINSGGASNHQVSVQIQSTHETAIGVMYASVLSVPTVNLGSVKQTDHDGTNYLFLVENKTEDFPQTASAYRLAIGITTSSPCGGCNGVILGLIPPYVVAAINAINPFCQSFLAGNVLTTGIAPLAYVNSSDTMIVYLNTGTADLSSISDGGDSFTTLANGTYFGKVWAFQATWTTGHTTLTVIMSAAVSICVAVQFYHGVGGIDDVFFLNAPSGTKIDINADSHFSNEIMGSAMFLIGGTGKSQNAWEGYHQYDNFNMGTDYPASSGYNASATPKNLKFGVEWVVGAPANGMFFMVGMKSISSPPTVTTVAAIEVDNGNARLRGTLTFRGSDDTVNVGFIWSLNKTLSVGNHNVSAGSMAAAGPFNYYLVGLSPNTTYYYRAWANSTVGYAVGAILNFTTLSTTISINGIDLSTMAIVFIFFAICVAAVVLSFKANRAMSHRSRGANRR